MKSGKFLFIALAALIFLAGSSVAYVGDELVGTYRGAFVGRDDYGSFIITVHPDGFVEGQGRSAESLIDLVISGEARRDGYIEFSTVEGGEVPIIFSGQIDFMKRIFGKWVYEDRSARGSFTAMPVLD